jgi:uncharacterized RDD family membrane protein YckC
MEMITRTIAPLWRRALGRLVDLGIWFGFIAVLSIATAQTTPAGTQSNPTWVEPFAFVPIFVYETWMLARRGGRTLGKMAAGTEVVSSHGGALQLGSCAIRSAVTWSFTVGLMLSFWSFLWIVGIALFVLNAAPALVDRRHRTLADLAARTLVERVEPAR